MPFVTLSEAKGLATQGGILHFAQNDRRRDYRPGDYAGIKERHRQSGVSEQMRRHSGSAAMHKEQDYLAGGEPNVWQDD